MRQDRYNEVLKESEWWLVMLIFAFNYCKYNTITEFFEYFIGSMVKLHGFYFLRIKIACEKYLQKLGTGAIALHLECGPMPIFDVT